MQSMIGKSVFSFIEGEAVRHIYAILHERVLKTGRPIEFISLRRAASPAGDAHAPGR